MFELKLREQAGPFHLETQGGSVVVSESADGERVVIRLDQGAIELEKWGDNCVGSIGNVRIQVSYCESLHSYDGSLVLVDNLLILLESKAGWIRIFVPERNPLLPAEKQMPWGLMSDSLASLELFFNPQADVLSVTAHADDPVPRTRGEVLLHEPFYVPLSLAINLTNWGLDFVNWWMGLYFKLPRIPARVLGVFLGMWLIFACLFAAVASSLAVLVVLGFLGTSTLFVWAFWLAGVYLKHLLLGIPPLLKRFSRHWDNRS